MAKPRPLSATKFHRWVNKFGGPEKLAVALGCSSYAVRHWLRRQGSPKANTLKRIVELSRGELDYSDVITATQQTLKQKRGK